MTVLLVLTLIAAACGDGGEDGAGSTTPTAATTAGGTSAPVTTGTQGPAGPTDCLQIWPEAAVQAVAGPAYTFFGANPTMDACTYTNIPGGIALAWRTGDRSDFELSKAGAAAVSGTVDVAVCDVGFYTELPGAALIMEAHSDSQGRTFTATISAVEIDTAISWATALLEQAC